MRQSLSRFAQTAHAAERRTELAPAVKSWYGRTRTHVVSRELCEQSLRYIESTLPKPNTCDIIDFNPGICVWSQVLHDFVKPRRHVLVEPAADRYREYLDPLLRQTNSRYRYAPDLETALYPQNDLLSPETTEELLSKRKNPQQQLEIGLHSSKTLLFTANLTSMYTKVPGYNGPLSKYILDDYYQSMSRPMDSIHQYGLARFIAWVDDDSRKVFVPTSVNGRTKLAVRLESSCNITQIASCSDFADGSRGDRRRWHELDEENMRRVAQKQEERGVTLPAHRMPPLPVPPLASLEPNTTELAKNRKLFPEAKIFIDRVLSVEATLAREEPELLSEYQATPPVVGHWGDHSLGAGMSNSEFKEAFAVYRRLTTQLRTYHTNFLKVQDMILEHRTLWRKITAAFRRWQGTDKSDTKELETLYLEEAELDARTKAMKTMATTQIEKAVDDYRAYDAEVQSLLWNKREITPLLVHPDDFRSNRHTISLLDITPRPEFVQQLDTFDKKVCFDYVVGAFHDHRNENLIRAVQRIVPAGYEEFLERIPELRNPLLGGWHDLSKLRIRSLPRDFFIKIALAFEKWPHRPSIESMVKPGWTHLQSKRLH